MENNISSQFSNEEIHSAFNLVFDTINGYVGNLKKESSDEILNGSIAKAQKLIDEILPYENVVKKLVEAKLLLENIHSGNGKSENQNESEKGDSVSGKQKTEDSTPEEGVDSDSMEFTPKENFRVPILKALIYLGGSAAIDKVVEFVKKDMKKKLKEKDFEQVNDDGMEKWAENLFLESEEMKDEGLLNTEVKDGDWEIVQKGIDYLAKHGK